MTILNNSGSERPADVVSAAAASVGGSTLRRDVPDATVARLPLYVRALSVLRDSGLVTCSSDALASATGVSSAQIRKDLSHLGTYGTRGVGYDVDFLRAQISRELGQAEGWDVIIVGAGHLGLALAAYQGFGSRGVNVAAIVDTDPSKVGVTAGDLEVLPSSRIAELVAAHGISMAVLATPASAAQSVAEQLIEAGVTSILNFAPVTLALPQAESGDVTIRQVDLAAELQILAFHEQRRTEEAVS